MEANYGFLIEKTGKKLKQTLQSVFNHLKVDLTADQWVILHQLHQHGALSQSQLGDKTYKDAPTVTRIIDLLEKKSYIVRKQDKEDRRKFMIELTPQGKKDIDRLIPYVIEFRKLGWNGLTDKELKQLQSILEKINSNLD